MSATLHFAQVAWFNSNKGFGVAGLLKNGQTVGIHRNSGRVFYRGTDHAELRLSGRRLETDPKERDPICLILGGKSWNNNLQAEVWGMTADWTAAYKDIQERNRRLRAIDANRSWLETEAADAHRRMLQKCNPRFRCLEKEHLFGKPTDKAQRTTFTGTKQELIQALTGGRGQQVPLVESGRLIDGYRYMRWFERETANGWVKCPDPRTIDLPPIPPTPNWSFEEAWWRLRGQQVFRAARGMVGVAFQWYVENRVVAQGNCEHITVLADDKHAATEFVNAEAEFLWEQSNHSSFEPGLRFGLR